jgi:hypothetical protein
MNSKATKLNIPDNGHWVAAPLAPEDLVAAAVDWIELPVSEESGEEPAADVGRDLAALVFPPDMAVGEGVSTDTT